jgi:threonine aldolase
MTEQQQISFRNDYSEGAHPRIMEALARDSMKQEPGYGDDSASARATKIILERCQRPDAQIHFVSGGTQANLLASAALLQPYESIIAAASGHICIHESGAIEATGHKVHELPHIAGKITAAQVEQIVSLHGDEHMVRPRMVFISQSTELGTLYSRQELEELAAVCRQHNLLLYIDGARLGSALASTRNDLSLSDIARLADAFYIGGTKNGALFGEAFVLCKPGLAPHFRNHLKQRGALLAKSRALGAQFEALFTDNLFLSLAEQANRMAHILADGIRARGFSFAYEPMTNQIFPVFPIQLVEHLQRNFAFYIWNSPDSEHHTIRLVTSWATPEQSVRAFLEALTR